MLTLNIFSYLNIYYSFQSCRKEKFQNSFLEQIINYFNFLNKWNYRNKSDLKMLCPLRKQIHKYIVYRIDIPVYLG